MSRLPQVSARECVNALQRGGFKQRRQTGSHIVMQRDDPYAVAVVPNHNPIGKGTLRSIIKQAGLTVDEFLALLEGRKDNERLDSE
ncbi:MAG: type II toxin-antitoxin system HicA family toxin [Chitinophagaceae bacterium]|nr:type II toxin-antitoxin system HicA family toxin [Anaerolineae bacterium]